MSHDPSQDWGPKPRRQGQPPAQPPTPGYHLPLPPDEPESRPAAHTRSQAREPGPSPQPQGKVRPGCGGVLVGALFVIALVVLIVGLLLAGYASAARELPRPDELQARVSHFASTLIYDRQGSLLDEVADPSYGRRTVVPLEQISPYLVDATIATEDPNFYRHAGVDPVGIARAVYHAVKDRDFASGPGGSTITQQLVKLTFLSPERSLSRKVKEAILAAEITRRYPKETVLAIYLNEIPYGNLAYGVEAAAETYFGKRAADLTLAEAALLAGLPQAPAYYDPYTRLWEADGRPGLVKRRQGVVLRLMVENGYIAPPQADAAWAEPIALKPLRQTYTVQYPHFVQYARAEVERVLGPELAAKGGLHIHTTLDPRIQTIAQEEVSKRLAELAGEAATNGAAVVIRPQTGEVLAMVGSADFNSEAISGQINMATSPRQPGSAIKPFTYLAAFEMPAAVNMDPAGAPSLDTMLAGTADASAIEPPGYWTPATAVMDIRTEFPDGANPSYVPANYDDKEHGLVTVRSALASSYNVPAVKALQHAGIARLKDVARRAGISTLTRDDYGLSLTLGGGEVTLLELTGAYAVLANEGTRVPLSSIACVLDAEGRLIWLGNGAEAVNACRTAAAGGANTLAVTPAAPQSALNRQHVYLITSILSDTEARRPMFGSLAGMLSLPGRPAAVKTGTSNDYRDAWTVGYTPDLAAGAWVGNADYTPMKKVAGGRGAAPIWHNVMARALEGQPARSFVQPPGIQRITVCADSGTLPGDACPGRREELFAEGQGPLPAAYDLHQRVRVDRVSGQLATEFTPADRIEERDVMIFPDKYRPWAEAHGYPSFRVQPPVYAFEPELALYSPINADTVTGIVSVTGLARVPDGLVWRLEYGVGPAPIGWGVLSGPNISETEGILAYWDTAATVALHETEDYSLRLAVYDPANMDYPIAVSDAVYISVESPTATPLPLPTETETPWPSPTATVTPPPAPSETPPVLPAETPTPTSTEPPPPTSAATPEAVQAAIWHPLEGALVSGQVAVIGVAGGTDLVGYELQYAPGPGTDEAAWQPIGNPVTEPSPGGLLGVWDTTVLPPGSYSLRLVVYDAGGGFSATQVQVEVISEG